ncbi:MAG TPA: hypothetical protein PKE31_21350 [Pseudomonadota bacterium]|jgi:hypothetical protein|nr:hypothetical protein [Pseudomonadota bacterium]
MQIQSLEALASALRAKLPQQSNFLVVNTRIIMQTGVNLKKIKPDQNHDAASVKRVLDALNNMGVSLDGGQS